MTAAVCSRLVTAAVVVYAAAGVWFWDFSGERGWAAALGKAGFVTAAVVLYRRWRGGRVALAACLVLLGGDWVGELAADGLRHGGQAGAAVGWLLPPAGVAGLLLVRRAAALRAFRRDQQAAPAGAEDGSSTSPGCWPGST